MNEIDNQTSNTASGRFRFARNNRNSFVKFATSIGSAIALPVLAVAGIVLFIPFVLGALALLLMTAVAATAWIRYRLRSAGAVHKFGDRSRETSKVHRGRPDFNERAPLETSYSVIDS